MVEVGMLFSSVCWHTEDNFLYSIDYLHSGEVLIINMTGRIDFV